MNEDAKAAAEKIWNGFKPAIEQLADKISALYEAAGSTRHCRHINELWHPENPAISIGFVPPEAKERLEALILGSGIHLHKGNGPLGKGVYFSLLYDSQLTEARLQQLGTAVEKETLTLKDAPPPAPKAAPSINFEAEELVARVEGLTVAKGDQRRTRPTELASFVDAFNGATVGKTPLEVVAYLKESVIYFDNLPDISRRELLRTLSMMEDAEKKA